MGQEERDLEEQANLLRLIVGNATTPDPSETDGTWVVETNLDDISGEWIGYCTSRLWEAGVLDVYATAIQMKKNRPGVKLSVLCKASQCEAVEAILFSETTTLGVRRWPVHRSVLRRQRTVSRPRGASSMGKSAGCPKVYPASPPSSRPAAVWRQNRDFRCGPCTMRRNGPSIRRRLSESDDGRTTRMLFFAEGSGLPGSLTLVVLGILAAIIGALPVGTQSYYTRNKSSAVTFEPLARRESAEPPHGANAPQTAPWEIGTYETARELSAELDSKMNTLVHLIEEADRSAARLEAALAAAGRKAGSAAGPTHERSPDTLATDPRRPRHLGRPG